MGNTDVNPILIEATVNLHERNTTVVKIGSKLMEEF
jgi:hypothetical protein